MKVYHPSRTEAKTRLDARTVKALARGRWLEILPALAPSLAPACANPGNHVDDPVHGTHHAPGHGDGFRLYGDAAETGGGFSNQSGGSGDGFALLQWVNGWSFPEALEAVAGWLGLDGRTTPPRRDPPPPRPVAPATPVPAKAARLRRIWRESEPLRAGDPVARYLEARGLALAGLSAETVRTHPGLDYWRDGRAVGTFPALLARVTGPDGSPVAVHCTYLDPGHPGRKAPVPAPRKMWTVYPGATRGAAVRLYPWQGGPLALAEGVETSMAVHLLTGIPAWAAISAGGMERAVVPPTVREVVVAGDNDRSGVGQRAAEVLAARLVAEGRAARVAVPPEPGDWLDVWQAERREVTR